MIKTIEQKVSQVNSDLSYANETLAFAASGLQILKSRIDQAEIKLFITGKAIYDLATGLGTSTNNSSVDLAVQDIVYTTGTQTINGAKTFSQTIVGNINGNATTANSAASVTNGVYTAGNQTINGIKTFSQTIVGSINGNAATVTSGVYTTGSQTINGTKDFSTRPTVNGTGVLLVGEASASNNDGGSSSTSNAVLLTGDQTISGEKTFTPIDSMEFSGADAYYIDNHVYFNSGNSTYISGTHIFYNGFVMVDETGASWKINIANGQLNVSSI